MTFFLQGTEDTELNPCSEIARVLLLANETNTWIDFVAVIASFLLTIRFRCYDSSAVGWIWRAHWRNSLRPMRGEAVLSGSEIRIRGVVLYFSLHAWPAKQPKTGQKVHSPRRDQGNRKVYLHTPELADKDSDQLWQTDCSHSRISSTVRASSILSLNSSCCSGSSRLKSAARWALSPGNFFESKRIKTRLAPSCLSCS